MRVLALLGLVLLAPPLVAQDSDRRAVLDVIQRFFATMTDRDSAGAASTLLPDGGFFRVPTGAGGGIAAHSTFRAYLAGLATGSTRMVERMWSPVVQVHRDVAAVWTPYDFHIDGTFSHCGVDAFTLLRSGGAWRISHASYTVERDGCAPSPLGPVQGLVWSYDMETLTPDGRLRDLSGNGHHGERLAPGETEAGVHGRARRFRTVADRVHVPGHPSFDLDGPLSIATWLRVDSLGIHQHVAACDDKWALWITPDDRWRLGDTRGGGWSTAPGSVGKGEWTSVVAVLQGTKGDALGPDVVALYVNGRRAPAERHLRTDQAREAAGVWNPGALHPTDACHVGFESHQGLASHRSLSFVSAIDELRVYHRALTDAEIAGFAANPARATPGRPQ
jgi:hypothetical protein